MYVEEQDKDKAAADKEKEKEEAAKVQDKGVANILFISETTVKTHVNKIFQKLQVNDRTQAVLYAINNGFLTKKVKLAV